MSTDEARLRRLEEALGFAEHAVEASGRELAVVSRQVHEVTQRLERLERRLDEALSRLPPPTSSAGAETEVDGDSGAALDEQ